MKNIYVLKSVLVAGGDGKFLIILLPKPYLQAPKPALTSYTEETTIPTTIPTAGRADIAAVLVLRTFFFVPM